MDWSELLSQAKNNPELKAMLSRMAGRSEPALEKGATEAAASELSPVIENATIPKESNLPVTRNESGVPSTLQADESSAARDVTSPSADGGSSPPELPGQTPIEPSNGSSNAAIGLGSAAGLAGLAALGGSNEQAPPQQQEQTSSRQKASSEVAKEEPKAVAPSKEKTYDNDEEKTDDSDVTPSQKDQSQAAEPDTETAAFQKENISPKDMLNFESREANPNELDKLLQQQREDIKGQQLMSAAARLGGAFAHVNPDVSEYKEGIKLAGLPVEQYKLKQANESNDPNSGLSQGMRDYMQKLGYPVSPNSSAAHIQSVLPFIFKDVEAKQVQAAHAADLKNKLQTTQMMKETQIQMAHENKQAAMAQAQATHDLMRQDKQHQQQQQQANKMDQQAEQLRGNPAIQQDMRTLQRVQNAMSIIKQYPDPNLIPPNVINILNTDLATIASGGVPGEGLIHEVATPTIMNRIGGGLQQLLNKPTGANAAAFVKQNEGIFNTLAGDAQKRLEDRYQRIGNTLGHSVNPEDRENYRRTYLPNHTYDKNNDLVPSKQQISESSMSSDPRDQVAIKTIMQNNPGISIQDAAKALSDYKKSKVQ